MRMSEHHWNIIGHCLKGNAAAIALVRTLNLAINAWDDLIDGDKTPTINEIHAAFIALLVDLPRNPFYREHMDELLPCIEVAIAEWLAANELEGGNKEDRARAHVLRFSGLSVYVMCARIVGGIQWAAEAATLMRKAIPAETAEAFDLELNLRANP